MNHSGMNTLAAVASPCAGVGAPSQPPMSRHKTSKPKPAPITLIECAMGWFGVPLIYARVYLRAVSASRRDPPRSRLLHQRLAVPRTQHGRIARHLTHEPRMREQNHERRVRHEPLETRQRSGTRSARPFQDRGSA